MVRVAGIEPASPDWKSGVLPTATKLVYWCPRKDLNPQLTINKIAVLTVELRRYVWCGLRESDPYLLRGMQLSCHWTKPAKWRRAKESNHQPVKVGDGFQDRLSTLDAAIRMYWSPSLSVALRLDRRLAGVIGDRRKLVEKKGIKPLASALQVRRSLD